MMAHCRLRHFTDGRSVVSNDRESQAHCVARTISSQTAAASDELHVRGACTTDPRGQLGHSALNYSLALACNYPPALSHTAGTELKEFWSLPPPPRYMGTRRYFVMPQRQIHSQHQNNNRNNNNNV